MSKEDHLALKAFEISSVSKSENVHSHTKITHHLLSTGRQVNASWTTFSFPFFLAVCLRAYTVRGSATQIKNRINTQTSNLTYHINSENSPSQP